MEDVDPSSPPDSLDVLRDFDSLYSKGLLVLGDFPRERRFRSLRIPVLTLSLSLFILHWGLVYRVWKHIRKRYGGYWGLLAAGVSSLCTLSLWVCVPPVKEYFSLEWDLAQKYKPEIYMDT